MLFKGFTRNCKNLEMTLYDWVLTMHPLQVLKFSIAVTQKALKILPITLPLSWLLNSEDGFNCMDCLTNVSAKIRLEYKKFFQDLAKFCYYSLRQEGILSSKAKFYGEDQVKML